MNSETNSTTQVKKVQVWVPEEMKQQMEAASQTHFINWSRLIRSGIQTKLTELARSNQTNN